MENLYRLPATVRHCLLIFALWSLALAGMAQARPGGQGPGTPALSTALNADGTVRAGLRGAFDARGYTLRTAADGRPAFLPAAKSQARNPLGAGDNNWSEAFAGNGTDGEVLAIAVDGNGNVYVGGRFTSTGTVAASNVARWNGSSWSALGSGIVRNAGGFGPAASVSALVLDQAGNLYAAGSFDAAGGVAVNNIARWNGSSWAAMGAGVDAVRGIDALAVDGTGGVFAGGSDFSIPGSAVAGPVARWNGAAWTILPGMATGSYNRASALIVDRQGNLYAGGYFRLTGAMYGNSVLRWSGAAWTALDSPAANYYFSEVRALAVDGQGNIYAGGYFVGSGLNNNTDSNVLKWNGTAWTAVGTHISSGGSGPRCTSLLVDGAGNLYAGGNVVGYGPSAPASGVLRWTGSSWAALGSGTGSNVYALAADAAGNLYAGGGFVTTGAPAATFLGRWSASSATWSAVSTLRPTGGTDRVVFDMVADGRGNMYAGGDLEVAGNVAASSIARWDGTRWTALGSGIVGLNNVYALAVDAQGNLYVGGPLRQAGGVAVNCIAKWNGTSWSALGAGLNDYVSDLAVDGSGNVYAAGAFTMSGNVAVNHVAKWNGSSWSALGTGISGLVNNIATDGAGNVYVGGGFTMAGGVPASNVAKWNGSTWSALGAGVADTVGIGALAADASGTLYVGSNRSRATGSSSKIERWGGTSWTTLGSSIPTSVQVLALDRQGNLYAGFDHHPLVPTVSRWTGTAWASLGTGTDGDVYALAPSGTGIYVGGYFDATGDGSKAMRNVGYYANAAGLSTTTRRTASFSLFPNPARQAAVIQLPASKAFVELLLTDKLGREVRHFPALAPGATQATLNLQGISPGFYLLRAGGSTQQLVVE